MEAASKCMSEELQKHCSFCVTELQKSKVAAPEAHPMWVTVRKAEPLGLSAGLEGSSPGH